jgi:hypothetical protein
MEKLLKSPDSPHKDKVEVLIVVIMDAIAEGHTPRVGSIVLRGTPIGVSRKTAYDIFLQVQ